MADNIDLQEPEKPKKKKSTGTISMPVFVGSLLGMGILVAVVVILILKFVINPQESSVDSSRDKMEESKDGYEELSEIDLEEQEFLEDQKKRKILEFERVTTNPMGSSKYVVVSFVINYLPHPEIPEEEFADGSLFIKNIQTKTINVVNSELRKMNEDELKLATYEELQDKFINNLKEYFKSNKLFLRELLITELIVQN